MRSIDDKQLRELASHPKYSALAMYLGCISPVAGKLPKDPMALLKTFIEDFDALYGYLMKGEPLPAELKEDSDG